MGASPAMCLAKAVLGLVCSTVGAGLLSVPSAFALCGWSAILLFVPALYTSFLTSQMLARSVVLQTEELLDQIDHDVRLDGHPEMARQARGSGLTYTMQDRQSRLVRSVNGESTGDGDDGAGSYGGVSSVAGDGSPVGGGARQRLLTTDDQAFSFVGDRRRHATLVGNPRTAPSMATAVVSTEHAHVTYHSLAKGTGNAVFAKIVFVVNAFTLFCVSLLYIVLAATMVMSVQSAALGPDRPQFTYRFWVVVVVLLQVPLLLFESVSEVPILALIGVVTTLGASVVVIGQSFTKKTSEDRYMPTEWSHGDTFAEKAEGLLTAFNTFMLGVGAHPMLPSIMTMLHDMKKQQDQLIIITCTIVTLIILGVGLTVYYNLGAALNPINLARKGNVLALVEQTKFVSAAQLLMGLHMLASIMFAFFPLCHAFEVLCGYEVGMRSAPKKRFVGRLVLLLGVCLLGILIPSFHALLMVAAATAICLLDITFPPIVYLLTFRRIKGRLPSLYWKIGAISSLFITPFVAVVGTWYASRDMVAAFKSSHFLPFLYGLPPTHTGAPPGHNGGIAVTDNDAVGHPSSDWTTAREAPHPRLKHPMATITQNKGLPKEKSLPKEKALPKENIPSSVREHDVSRMAIKV